MRLIKALKLKKGDLIGIISPSEPIVTKRRIKIGIRALKKLGLKVILGKNVFHRHGGYMAGTIQERLDDFHSMFKNRKIKAVFTSRGGFCCNQLLDGIDYKLIKNNPKIILGYSDITVLLNAIHKKTGLVTFHGPSLGLVMSKWLKSSRSVNFTKSYFNKALFSEKPIGNISRLSQWKILKKGKATGRLIGGNLSVMRTLLGTEYCPDWKNAILFWEDCNITYEDLDHFLVHLKLAGVFDGISGMIIGKNKHIQKIEPKSDLNLNKLKFFSTKRIILERTQKYKFPIISNVGFGHECEQIIFPIGVRATINTAKKIFSIDESSVI